jgi:hypothetical protein
MNELKANIKVALLHMFLRLFSKTTENISLKKLYEANAESNWVN